MEKQELLLVCLWGKNALQSWEEWEAHGKGENIPWDA